MKIELITIGDELLLGFTIDTNAAHAARALADIGVEIVRRSTVGDGAEQIAAAVSEALDRTGAVITTGGLGPTSDDLTKPSIAALFGRSMVVDDAHVEWMRQRWRERWKREMPESNIAQAMIPEGATKLTNNHGSAPGIWLEDERGRWVAMLPGVPREMRGMLHDTLVPLVRERVVREAALTYREPHVVRSRTLRTIGVAESLVQDKLRAAEAQLGDVSLAFLPSANGVDLRLTMKGVGAAEADRQIAHAAEILQRVMGDAIYGEGDADMAAVVLDACRAHGVKVAVAESCTGGLLGARLTETAGSSDVFLGGVIAYANRVKETALGVSAADLNDHGAVSEPVVRQMATGVRERIGADVGLAITGIAGPGGGTADKPVGTVWVACDLRGNVQAQRLQLFGDRDEIRFRAAQATLDMLRRALAAG